MSHSSTDSMADRIGERLGVLGRSLGEREAEHADSLARAADAAGRFRAVVAAAMDRFHEAAAAAGAPQLKVEVSEPRTDDKHLRSVEFELRRGKHVGVVTVKSRGDVTLVGPFRQGKTEGPCRSIPIDAEREIEGALGDFLVSFVEEAATP